VVVVDSVPVHAPLLPLDVREGDVVRSLLTAQLLQSFVGDVRPLLDPLHCGHGADGQLGSVLLAGFGRLLGLLTDLFLLQLGGFARLLGIEDVGESSM
jgi:hypothetical protein